MPKTVLNRDTGRGEGGQNQQDAFYSLALGARGPRFKSARPDHFFRERRAARGHACGRVPIPDREGPRFESARPDQPQKSRCRRKPDPAPDAFPAATNPVTSL